MPHLVETIIRSVCIIIGLFFITKLLGKKQLSSLSFFEYIVGITVGDIAGTLSMDGDLSLVDGVTSIIIWSLFPLVVSMVSLKSKRFRYFLTGKPTTFIENGKILEKNLRKEKYTIDELLEQLRKKNIFRVADVEFATLDTNGELAIFLKRGKQPLKVEDFFPQQKNMKPPYTVIMDGQVDENSISKAGYSIEWLHSALRKKNLSIKEIFFGQVSQYGELTLDLYEDVDNVQQSHMNEKILCLMGDLQKNLEQLSLAELGSEEFKYFTQDISEIKAALSPYLHENQENPR